MYFIIYIIIVIAGLGLMGTIFSLLVNKKLNESNAILWLFIGFVTTIAGIFPEVVTKLSDFFFITYPPAFIFTMAIIILLFIVLKLSIYVTELTAKMQEMASEVSILRLEADRMKQEEPKES